MDLKIIVRGCRMVNTRFQGCGMFNTLIYFGTLQKPRNLFEQSKKYKLLQNYSNTYFNEFQCFTVHFSIQ